MRQKIRNSKMYTKTKFSVIFKFVSVILFVPFFLLVAIIFQMIFVEKYNVLLLKATVYISYSVGFTALGILTYKYLVWSRENQDTRKVYVIWILIV